MAFKELKHEDWEVELSRGLEYRRDYGIEDSWSNLEALYYNVDDSQGGQGPNIIAATGDSLMSQLNVPDPKVSVKPSAPGFTDAARVVEAVDNMLIRELKMKDQAARSTLHGYLFGRMIWKVGYDSEFGYDPRFDLGGANVLGSTLTQRDKKGRLIEFGRNNPRPGMPWVRTVLPHDFVVPWGTIEIDDAPWCMHRVVRHVEDVKADDKYEKTKGLEPSMSMQDFVESYTSTRKPFRAGNTVGITSASGKSEGGATEFVELWEIHDRRTGRVLVMATGYDRMIRDEVDVLQIDGLPFVSESLVPNSRSFWVTPDAFYLRQDQNELTDIALQSAKERRTGVLKGLIIEGAMEEEEIDKLTSPDVAAIAKVKQGNDLDKILKIIQHGPNPMVYQEAEFTRRNAREVVGLSRNQAGEYEARGRRTATEAREVASKSDIRMSRRADKLRSMYVETIRKINGILFEFWKAPRITEVIGPDGLEKWVRFTGNAIKATYRYEIGFSNEHIQTVEERKREAVQLYSALRQDPLIDPGALSSYLSNAYADPELAGIFAGATPGQLGESQNAGLRLPMSGVQEGPRGLQAPAQAG